MKPSTAKMLKDLEHEIFASDECESVRAILNAAPQNSGEPEDIDMVLDRVDKYAPAMHRFIDSVLSVSPSK